jgi:hypothetical protein
MLKLNKAVGSKTIDSAAFLIKWNSSLIFP